MENKILIVDIETCGGFTYKDGFPIEIGIVELDINTGVVEVLLDTLCKHKGMRQEHRKSWIFDNSDLTVEEVQTAPMWEEVLPKIQEIVDKYPMGITAFNRRFDIDYLTGFGVKFGKLQPCPMLVLKPIMNLPFKNGGIGKFPNCEEAWHYCYPEVEYVELHRGCDDSIHEAQIIWKMIQDGVYIVE